MNAPDASCTLSANGTTTRVAIESKCKVIYKFNTKKTSKDLRLPYIVTVDGKVLSTYAARSGILGPSREIELLVDTGSRVALFLNSDVHPRHRKQPVYEVLVGTRDVHVSIVETTGRNIGHLRPTVGMPMCRRSNVPGTLIDTYDAHLTGDIWMLISHVYTEAGWCPMAWCMKTSPELAYRKAA